MPKCKPESKLWHAGYTWGVLISVPSGALVGGWLMWHFAQERREIETFDKLPIIGFPTLCAMDDSPWFAAREDGLCHAADAPTD